MIQPVKEKIILGIDPGTTIMGYGVLRVRGTKPEMIAMGIIDLRKFANHYLKLRHIHERVLSIIESYLPDELAIEAPFFGKNVQSMLKLGRAQGVAMAVALSRDIPITEYAPLKIKMAITGNGQASKEQVADMLQRMLRFSKDDMPTFMDATDGLAAAYCHFLQMGRPAMEKGYSSWKDMASYNIVAGDHEFFSLLVNKYVDIVFANEEEAKAFTGKEPEEALDIIAKMCSIAIVKVGARGSLIRKGTEEVRVEAVPVAKVVDTTGAGDFFAAGFLYGLTCGYSLEKCGKIGAILSGEVIQVIGTELPDSKWEKIKEDIIMIN